MWRKLSRRAILIDRRDMNGKFDVNLPEGGNSPRPLKRRNLMRASGVAGKEQHNVNLASKSSSVVELKKCLYL